MSINISYSSELMSNYIQAETVGPGHTFQALQSQEGHSLLLSISTDNVLYLTKELVGEKTGWQQSDLSSVLYANFSNDATISVKTFAAGQNSANSTLEILLVLTVNNVDHLYFANSYDEEDDGNLVMNWMEIPFDADTTSAASLVISSVYLISTANYALSVVDIQNATDGNIDRYYIDNQKKKSDKFWNSFAIPGDYEGSQVIKICGGRKAQDGVDGVYNLGLNAEIPTIIYQELYDEFGDGTGFISRLQFPSNANPNAIASTPSASTPATTKLQTKPVVATITTTYTDLYTTTDAGDLYFFAADNQHDGSIGLPLINNELFQEVTNLYAYTTDTKVVVWGLNRAQQVFYTQAPINEVTNPASWSYPLPIASGVEQISPYVNRINGGNTYFAHTGTNELKKVFQDPNSSCWQKQDILLPTNPNVKSQKFDSYTTQIKVVDEFNNPVVDAEVEISSSYRVPVYINYHYYVLDTTSISVKTDATGSIQIVQKVEGLQGACLQLQSSKLAGILDINPMNNAAGTITTLTTPESLSAATATDDKGNNPKPLVPTDTSEDDLNAAAASIQSLSDAYDSFLPSDTNAKQVAFVARPTPTLQLGVVSNIGDAMSDFADAVVVAAGDVFSMLEHAADYVIEIIEDAAQEVWNFVCTIGGKILTFVVDTIEKVVGAIQAIFQAIKTLVKDLIQFIKFLFSWGDIQLTKDVFSNMFTILMQGTLDSAQTLKDGIDEMFQGLEDKISSWADIGDAGPSLNDMSSSEDTSNMTSAPGDFLQYHFTNNAGNATYTSSDAANLTLPEGALDEVINTLKLNTGSNPEADETIIETLKNALQLFNEEIFKDDKYKTMSLTDLLKTAVGILAETLLQLAQDVVDALLNLIIKIADVAIGIITQPIRIPVVSDILEEFFDTSISFSWLDIIMLIGAVPATLGYKILKQEAPFSSDDNYTNQLLNAKNMDDLERIIKGTSFKKSNTLSLSVVTEPTPIQGTIFILGRLFGSVSSAVSAVFVIPSNTVGLGSIAVIKAAKTINNLLGVGLNVLVNVFAQPVPIQNQFTNVLYYTVTSILTLEKIIFATAVIGYRHDAEVIDLVEGSDQIASLIIKAFLGLTTIEHIVELFSNYEDNPVQSNLAFAQCGVDFCGIANSVIETALVFVPPAPSATIATAKVASEIIDTGIYCAAGILQLVQSTYAAAED